MTGMFGHLSEAVAVQEFVGCNFEMALAIVRAAHEPPAAPADNVIHVDFVTKRRIDDGQLA
jgi:hypothetical protein